MDIHKSTPQEFERTLRQKPAVVFPIGAIEWHDEHLPLGIDTIKAAELASRIADEAGCFAAPPIFYGYPKHFAMRKLTGTLCPDIDSLQNYILSICRNMVNVGIRAFLFLSGHYERAQMYMLKLVCEHLMEYHTDVKAIAHMEPDYTICAGISAFSREDVPEPDGTKGDHAGWYETSLLMYLRPELVRKNQFDAIKTEIMRNGQSPSADAGKYLVEQIIKKAAQDIEMLLQGQLPPYIL